MVTPSFFFSKNYFFTNKKRVSSSSGNALEKCRSIMFLMDVVTTYLYGSIDNDIYIKVPKGFQLSEENITNPCSIYFIKLQ